MVQALLAETTANKQLYTQSLSSCVFPTVALNLLDVILLHGSDQKADRKLKPRGRIFHGYSYVCPDTGYNLHSHSIGQHANTWKQRNLLYLYVQGKQICSKTFQFVQLPDYALCSEFQKDIGLHTERKGLFITSSIVFDEQ